jgi:hypothetical protein
MSRCEIGFRLAHRAAQSADCRGSEIRRAGHAAGNERIKHVWIESTLVARPHAVTSKSAIVGPTTERRFADRKIGCGLIKSQKWL